MSVYTDEQKRSWEKNGYFIVKDAVEAANAIRTRLPGIGYLIRDRLPVSPTRSEVSPDLLLREHLASSRPIVT